jgi:outer membrane usher protein
MAGLSLLVMIGQAAMASTVPPRFGALPGPDESAMRDDVQPLQLELIVNGVSSGLIVPVSRTGQGLELASSDLAQAGLILPPGLGDRIAVETLAGVSAHYDVGDQRLRLDVPAEWFPRQSIGGAGARRERPVSSFGVLLNYDLNFSDSDGRAPVGAAWLETRVFGGFGQIGSTGVLRSRGPGSGMHFTRYDTRWVHSDDERMITYEAGDFVTRSLPGNRPVRMAGFQISRDFSVRPDIVTYPLPEFSGKAGLPSAVDLFIDGYRTARADVVPGPFTVDAMPGLSGAGEAVIAVTDMLGRRVATTVPFYVSNDLLRPGLSDFAASAGVLRKDYGRSNFAYGDPAASASLRYGVAAPLTVEGSAEASDGFVSGSIGALLQLGTAGVVRAAYARSDRGGDAGDRLTVEYQYRTRSFGLAASHVRESEGFSELGDLDYDHHARATTNVTASVSREKIGSFALSYIEQTGRGQDVRLANGSWSMPIAKGATFYASGGYELDRRAWSGALNLMIPLGGDRGSAAAGFARDGRGGTLLRADYSRAIPVSGGLGMSASVARSSVSGVYGSGELGWRTSNVELRGGAYGGRGQFTHWAGASGSIVTMDGQLFAANRIADSFVVVSTSGRAGVPVLYENQPVGVSDSGGHVLVPWVAGYYPAKYQIDPFDLPATVSAPQVERRVAVVRGSGFLLEFAIRETHSARITLVDAAGQPLAVGAFAKINGAAPVSVGWDGLLFAEDLESENVVVVTLPTGSTCQAAFIAARSAGQPEMIGPVTCR